MRRLVIPDEKASTFRDASPLPDEPFLQQVALLPRSLMAFVFVARGNFYVTMPVTRFDRLTGAVTLKPDTWYSKLRSGSDRYQMVNHPSLIRKPGHWAFESLGSDRTRIYFRPVDPADLNHTQFRKSPEYVLRVGQYQDRVSHVRIEGLEICGSAVAGLQILRTDDITVSHCIFHNNDGNGVSTCQSDNVRILNCVSVANGLGIGIASGQDVLVERNEVALNMIDGINVAGNVTGRPGGEPESSNVTLRRNYFHHHMFLNHPDNVQAFRGVKNFTIEDNVLLFGGQGIMTEEVEGGTIRNCVVGRHRRRCRDFRPRQLQRLGRRELHCRAGRLGAFSLTGKGYRIRNNILWNNPLSIEPTVQSDYNLYLLTKAEQPVCRTGKPTWRSYLTPAQAAEALGREQHSRRADPKFHNAPFCQAVAPQDDGDRPDRLVLRLGSDVSISDFRENDRVEINGDGVLRRIAAVEGKAIRFQPPLPVRPFREALVWNWKQAVSVVL